ncbi:MAG: AsmA family protein [Nitrospirales bacterium]|nr:AsmA family protein [Nitrospira sp.]MDR4501126.1 AsmA family protein [Nitrospirales bacterium]
MKILFKISGFFLILVGAVVLLLTLFLNDMIKAGIERLGPELTGTPVTLTQTNLSVFSGQGQLEGLTIGNPSGYETGHALKVGNIQVALSLSSMLSGTLLIEEILIESPEIVVEGGLTQNNLQQIQERVEAYASSNHEGDQPDEETTVNEAKVKIEHLRIHDARVQLALSLLDGNGPTISLPDIHLRDIGKKTDGTTWQDVTEQLLDAIQSSVLQVIPKAGKHIERGIQKMTESVQDLGVVSKDAVSEVFQGIGELLQPQRGR